MLRLPGNRRGLQAVHDLEAVVGRVVARRRARNDDGAARTTDTADVLGVLLAADMPDRQVRDEVMTLLLAGHETTANALTWSWFLLSRHPDARRR